AVAGPLERGAAAGSLERGAAAGPLERGAAAGSPARGAAAGPLERGAAAGSPARGAVAGPLAPVRAERGVGLLGVRGLPGPFAGVQAQRERVWAAALAEAAAEGADVLVDKRRGLGARYRPRDL